ncbi:hypothetical protein MZM54_00295 [[Brevibacterium] frigoritolerans]|nr:hypothetical protein [Peribacillus frigoritolerans]
MDKLNKEEITEKQEKYYSLIESREIVENALKLIGEWSKLYIYSNEENDKETLKGLKSEEQNQRNQLEDIDKTMKNIKASISKEELKRWKKEAKNRNALLEAI